MARHVDVLSELCASLLEHQVFCLIMRARLYTLARGAPDFFDDETRKFLGIPKKWQTNDIVNIAKFGRRLDRFSRYFGSDTESQFNACRTHLYPAPTVLVHATVVVEINILMAG
jgi:hypothetical protein